LLSFGNAVRERTTVDVSINNGDVFSVAAVLLFDLSENINRRHHNEENIYR
jgi:hypothetical protein